MGSCCVKQELTEEDIHFLKKHTRYDEETIREWYAGFLQVQYNDETEVQSCAYKDKKNIFFVPQTLKNSWRQSMKMEQVTYLQQIWRCILVKK